MKLFLFIFLVITSKIFLMQYQSTKVTIQSDYTTINNSINKILLTLLSLNFLGLQ